MSKTHFPPAVIICALALVYSCIRAGVKRNASRRVREYFVLELLQILSFTLLTYCTHTGNCMYTAYYTAAFCWYSVLITPVIIDKFVQENQQEIQENISYSSAGKRNAALMQIASVIMFPILFYAYPLYCSWHGGCKLFVILVGILLFFMVNLTMFWLYLAMMI